MLLKTRRAFDTRDRVVSAIPNLIASLLRTDAVTVIFGSIKAGKMLASSFVSWAINWLTLAIPREELDRGGMGAERRCTSHS